MAMLRVKDVMRHAFEVVSPDAHLHGVRVDDCMTPDPQRVASNTPLHQVADLLSLNKFGATPVVDKGKRVGMISYIDFVEH